MISSNYVDKAEVRKLAKARRDAAYGLKKQERANTRLAAWLVKQQGDGAVAGYMATGTEVNPMEVMKTMVTATKRKVCVPVVVGIENPLEFRQWWPSCQLETGRYDIAVPTTGKWLNPVIVVVPLLAFDRRGYRLGYGCGYYDRTLQNLRKTGRVLAIGFSFAAQETEYVPFDEFDQKLDAIVTEQQMLVFNPVIGKNA